MTMNADAVPECYPLGIIQEAIASRIPREFSGWREWPGTRVLAQAVIEALKVRETVLAAHAQSPVADAQGEQSKPAALTVWYGSMPESNGKTNWTAILHKGDIASGMTIDRSEYPDRVRYEADRARWLIGELAEEPWILDYDADKHSGYAAPAAPAQSHLISSAAESNDHQIAAPARSAEPIYQVQKIDGAWEDVQPFEKAGKYGRIVYAAPQPAQSGERLASYWKGAIDNELVTIGSTADSFPSAREAVKALIDWHVAVALDPAVSSDAQALIDKSAPSAVVLDVERSACDAACDAAYARQSGNRRTDESDFGAGWEYAIEWMQARAAVPQATATQPAQTGALRCCRMGCDKPSVCERLGECRIKAAAQPASGVE